MIRITIKSDRPGEGKSWAALLIAHTLRQAGVEMEFLDEA